MRQKSTNGFTLLEILVVITVIAILAAVLAPSYIQSIRRANLNEAAVFVAAELRRARSLSQRNSASQPITWTTTELKAGVGRSMTIPNGATLVLAPVVPPPPPPALPVVNTYKAPYGELSNPDGFRIELVDSSGQWRTAVDAMGVTGKVIRRAVVARTSPIR